MEDMTFEPGPAFATKLDQEDDLAGFRDAFVFAEPDLIYMDATPSDVCPAKP